MKIIDKFFGDKKGNTLIYILLVVGIFLIAGGSLIKKEEPLKEEVKKEEVTLSLSESLEEILSLIKGAGRVDVMVVNDNEGKRVFGYDEEKGKKKTVILNGAQGEEALVRESKSPVIRGVIVVCDGGGNTKIKEEIKKAVSAVLSLAPHKIEVFERKEAE